MNEKYYMYYVAPNTVQGGSAIGVATAPTPAGPWTDAGAPVVAPENNPYNGAPGRADEGRNVASLARVRSDDRNFGGEYGGIHDGL